MMDSDAILKILALIAMIAFGYAVLPGSKWELIADYELIDYYDTKEECRAAAKYVTRGKCNSSGR